jgi:hypothetical protein
MAEATITDDVQAYKDLIYYEQSDEWKQLCEYFLEKVESKKNIIMESKWDIDLCKSEHDIMSNRKDIYIEVIWLVKDKKAQRFVDYFTEQVEIIDSNIVSVSVNQFGISLDAPTYSKTDCVREDRKTYKHLSEKLRNIIDTLDPKKKGTKDTMNPYNEDYSNEVVENTEETETPPEETENT